VGSPLTRLVLRAVNERGVARDVADVIAGSGRLRSDGRVRPPRKGGTVLASPDARDPADAAALGPPAPRGAARAAAARSGRTTAAIELAGLHKRFGSVAAVAGIDLTVRAGEVVAFLGPNGAGKTTTIDMILGLSTPTAGSVQVYGIDAAHAVRRGLVSAVMQTGGLLKDLTVSETLVYTAALFASTRPVGEVMRRAGIDSIASRRVGRCSGGEQQRLRFAMALLPDPALLILDEPTQGMDVQGRRDFWRQVRADAEAGRTVLFATPDLEEAAAYADRIVLIRHGQMVADGSAAQVKALASGRVVRATLPGADEAVLAGLPGVTGVEVRGDSVIVSTRDSDAVARFLLAETTAHDVEITAAGLEEAFLALTGDDDGITEPDWAPQTDEQTGRAR
jgi:ABC-2 type transport system ATP-binding protein